MDKEQMRRAGAATARAAKKGAEVTANTLSATSKVVASNQAAVASGTEAAVHGTGVGVQVIGAEVAQGGRFLAKRLYAGAPAAGDAVRSFVAGTEAGAARRAAASVLGGVTNLFTRTLGVAADAAGLTGIAVAAAGHGLKKSAPVLGGAVGGAVKGAAVVVADAADGVLLPADRIEQMRQELQRAGMAIQEDSEAQLKRKRRQDLLDTLVVGGFTLSQLVQDPRSVPPEIERAFELAYPRLASSGQTFAEAADRMSSEQLVGLVSGVKGKLFELKLLDDLNGGELPDGWHAELAPTATQAGWDIRIVDENGIEQELLQAKATDSAHYVAEALERYPNIDVLSTSEVHAELMAVGLAEGVRDSGITELSLDQIVTEAAADHASVLSVSDLIPSSIGLAVISLSVLRDHSLTLRDKGAAIGERSARAGVAGYVGQAAMVATQTWWIGLLAGVSSRWLASRGERKRQQYDQLREALQHVRGMRARQTLLLGRS
jgi:hypothetical protein